MYMLRAENLRCTYTKPSQDHLLQVMMSTHNTIVAFNKQPIFLAAPVELLLA